MLQTHGMCVGIFYFLFIFFRLTLPSPFGEGYLIFNFFCLGKCGWKSVGGKTALSKRWQSGCPDFSSGCPLSREPSASGARVAAEEVKCNGTSAAICFVALARYER